MSNQPLKIGTSKSAELVEEIANAIRRDVVTGRFPMGCRLRQETLAAEFGVSRTPIREALRKLQAEGLIVFEPRRGALIRSPAPREIREAYRVRAELEGLAAELAAGSIADGELRELAKAEYLFNKLVARMSRAAERGDDIDVRRVSAAWGEANDLFHEIIQRAAKNQALRMTIVFLHRSIPRGLTGMALVANTRLLQANAKEHAAIRKAIEKHDSDLARRLVSDHIVRSGEIAASWFELQESSQHDLA